MEPPIPPITIYTIGHSNLTFDTFTALIGEFGIDTLVDIRSNPYSQYNPQFNKEDLAQLINASGVDYKYAGDYLGGRPKDPDCYKNGIVPEGKADYLHLVDYARVTTKDFFLKGIDRLIALASDHKVGLMCSEEDPAACHRHHLIGKYLSPKGIHILHIRANGECVRDQDLPYLPAYHPVHQPSLF